MRKRSLLWPAASVLAICALLASAAAAASRIEFAANVSDGERSMITAEATTQAGEQAGEVSERQAAKANENEANEADETEATEPEETEATEASETEATEAAENEAAETEDNDRDETAKAGKNAKTTNPSGTSTRPGWGCGDDNHKHSGPPGQTTATKPSGCANAQSNPRSTEHSSAQRHQTTTTTTTTPTTTTTTPEGRDRE